jgi:hypothetical protein
MRSKMMCEWNGAVYLGGIVGETVTPYKIKVILELAFRLIDFVLDLSEHCTEVHRIRDN